MTEPLKKLRFPHHLENAAFLLDQGRSKFRLSEALNSQFHLRSKQKSVKKVRNEACFVVAYDRFPDILRAALQSKAILYFYRLTLIG